MSDIYERIVDAKQKSHNDMKEVHCVYLNQEDYDKLMEDSNLVEAKETEEEEHEEVTVAGMTVFEGQVSNIITYGGTVYPI